MPFKKNPSRSKRRNKTDYIDKKLYNFENYLKFFVYFSRKRGISEKIIYLFLFFMISIYIIVFSIIPINQQDAFQ